ncbi:Ribokinase-like protein [Cokeromyces recurvatus]|uniref:Ribokinase-like protein n=1 Tax=Cokeromyces recurvatus TaxID=90255 RepID=UPI00221ED8AA|nr:Ribokinase-like protein [Cokeromyces recurvatus]KAI7900938.1 Ribokinase-like protein [Cokeromyces recurvatus]
MPARIPDLSKVRQIVPPLSSKLHKGQAGRVGVVGGSEEYTGAPYFSGIASMKVGVDLCHIFCEPGAGTVIKSYSPDLIVHPYLRTKEKKETDLTVDKIVERVTSVFSRVHVLVVGPGLSRDEVMQDTAKELIKKAREQDMAIVIDADGLYLVQQYPETVKGYKKAVLTPNVVEFKRLCEKMNVQMKDEKEKEEIAKELSQALGGVTVVQKGTVDYITNGDEVLKCDIDGGLKRMGGQGDILSGAIAAFLAWGKAYENNVWEHSNEVETKDIALYATYGACHITRTSSRLAFQKYGRSVLTSHMLEEIGASYDQFMKH